MKKPFVGVHHHTEEARVGVDELSLVTDLQVVEDGGVIEEGQVGHVLALLELRWVDLPNLSRLEHFFLKREIHIFVSKYYHIVKKH